MTEEKRMKESAVIISYNRRDGTAELVRRSRVDGHSNLKSFRVPTNTNVRTNDPEFSLVIFEAETSYFSAIFTTI